MSDTPRKTEDDPRAPDGDTADEPRVVGGDTVDQPTVNLSRQEPKTEPLLEDEPAEYELPGRAPQKAESAGSDRPDAEKAEGRKDPGLPTSDPVFPTTSPQLRPPVTPTPGDVSGFGAPGGNVSDRASGSEAGPAKAAEPADVRGPAAGVPAAGRRPVKGAGETAVPGPRAETEVARPLPPTTPPRRRSAAEIRADIEAGRQELSQSVEVLRDKVEELTDWRGQVRKHRREITIAAAAVGFAIGARFMLKRRRR